MSAVVRIGEPSGTLSDIRSNTSAAHYCPKGRWGSIGVDQSVPKRLAQSPKVSRRADLPFLVEENDDHAAVNLLGVDLNQAERLQ